MSFHEVRREILEDHRELGEVLASVEDLCARLEGGEAGALPVLRDRGRALLERFAAHLALEDRILLPALRSAARNEAADELMAEHREQRELLQFLLGRLDLAQRPALLLVRELQQFATFLREEMRQEDDLLLRP